MDLLSKTYSDDEVEQTTEAAVVSKKPRLDLAPDVTLDDPQYASSIMLCPSDREILVNVPHSDLTLPMYGPVHPNAKNSEYLSRNILTGHVEEQAISEIDFRTQYRSFLSFGYARDPTLSSGVNKFGGTGEGVNGTGFVGDVDKALEWKGILCSKGVNLGSEIGASIYDSNAKHKNLPRRKSNWNSEILDGEDAYKGPWAGFDGDILGQPEGAADAPEAPTAITEKPDEPEIPTERTIFHGKEERDYLGRSYIHVPMDLEVDLKTGEPGEQECFLPKKLIHTWSGHNKAVTAIRFFPDSGHLLLSCSMDTKVKLWDVYHQRHVLRTYLGHTKAVRDITFSKDGKRFLSCSYDRMIKLWDTETGQCIHRFTNYKTPYCVRFHPELQHVFLAGCADKKIIQWDTNTGDQTQEYDQHLGAVNTVTFVDDNRRFVSTSDDKTIRVWEFGIPVTIKYIAEPHMHSMPSVALHPNKKWLACQSMDNQIVVYGAMDRFRAHRRKRFVGHSVAGYACQVSFSPDGRFVSSGDSEGRVWFWDWKSCRVIKKMRAHDNVCMGVEWHPRESSKVATCGWDNTIKYWD